MAKTKNRCKRKKAKIAASNKILQEKFENDDFVRQFTGYMQVSLKNETDDETIRRNVIRRGQWQKAYRIFKHDRKFYVEVTLFKTNPAIKPAIMGMETDVIEREYIAGVADLIINELKEGHDDINYDLSYARIYA